MGVTGKYIYQLATVSIFTFCIGCTFEGGPPRLTPSAVNDRWHNAALTTPYDANLVTVIDDAQIVIQHGASCASADRAVSKNNAGFNSFGIAVEENMAIPERFNSSTVFLNGWRLHYTNKDHHVKALSTAIVDIDKADNILSWRAGGIISDKNGDDGFSWCYHYTVLMWNSSLLNINAVANDSDKEAALTFLSLDDSNPLEPHQVQWHSLADFPSARIALLPRGFGVMYPHSESDHHLLQFAFKYGDSSFISTSEDGSGSDISWAQEAIFADDYPFHHYWSAEVVSTIHGSGLGLIQPEFNIYTVPELGGENGIHEVQSETIVVEDIPFDYAMPMLTGWDMLDAEKDIHVKDIGVWIESFDYDKVPGADTGTLTYTIKAVFHDRGGHFSSPGAHYLRHQVSILGLNGSDLVAEHPTGTTGTLSNDNSMSSSFETTSTTPANTISFSTTSSSKKNSVPNSPLNKMR